MLRSRRLRHNAVDDGQKYTLVAGNIRKYTRGRKQALELKRSVRQFGLASAHYVRVHGGLRWTTSDLYIGCLWI